MTTENVKIIYTKVDEAPALATYSLLPILRFFTRGAGVDFEQWDISLAGRILANFPDYLTEEQRVPDYLTELGKLVKKPEANIMKLPNISASVPQLQAAIVELREKGYIVPVYPETGANQEDRIIKDRYAKVLGSAVNPILREGNSDRRAAGSVKRYGLKNPHKMMRAWPTGSKTRVATMQEKDFLDSEKSLTVDRACTMSIEFVDGNGEVTTLKEKTKLLAGEVISASVMNVAALAKFYEDQMEIAKKTNVLLSLHLKATMMKVSDPVMFGHCVSVYFKELFEKHGALLDELSVNVNNGLADLHAKIKKLPADRRKEVEEDIASIRAARPGLAMVDSSKGITNLHLPNNVIIDASMPVVVRDGGRMWGEDDALHDVIAMVPDRSYATMYQEVIEDCQKHGAYDPGTMGGVANVGLMAQKAEEYGSHDKTFIAQDNGAIRGVDERGVVLLQQDVEKGDIFRMCQTKDAPIRDWVKLAVNRARISGEPAIFWLDENRGHDRELITKVERYLAEHNTKGLSLQILPPVAAMRVTLERVRKSQNTIAVTGNVLRDYLTDLFPILELGTSARMLSIVPLMNGGGLFETGAGGSAPKHVQQFLKENHLRWDSLGEFCALVASFEHLATVSANARVALLAETLDQAVSKHLEQGKMPSRNVKELDNRGSHFYLALYWAQALAAQEKNTVLQKRFAALAKALQEKEAAILDVLIGGQGSPIDIGGYYYPDNTLVENAMRPSAVMNEIIDTM